MVQLHSTKLINSRVANRMQGGLFQWTLTVCLCAGTLCWFVFCLIQLGLRVERDLALDGDLEHKLNPIVGHDVGDGRWSIGLYRGESSPLQLQPVDASPWGSDDDAHRAWPISNPVFTRWHVEQEDTGHGTFVSDPFLFLASKKIASLIGTSQGSDADNDQEKNLREQVQEFIEDPLGVKSSLDEEESGGNTHRQIRASIGATQVSGDDESATSDRKNRLEDLIQGPLYLFFQTKNLETRKGDIGVAVSNNGGLAWTYLGIALASKNTSFSYPFIFEWNENIYLLPEAKDSGVLTLYKAQLNNFPFEWVEERTLLDVPVVNPSMVEWNGLWYLFVTDEMGGRQTYGSSTQKEEQLHIYHAETPLGPWMSHFLNPVMTGNEGSGARMAGSLVKQDEKLYRFGQDRQGLYGKDVLAFRIDTLNPKDFVQTRVKFQAGRIRKGTGAWNSQRRHHVDMTQLPDGSWLGVLDGDYFQDQSETRREPLLAKYFYPIFVLGAFIAIRTMLRSSRYKILSTYWGSLVSSIARPESLGQQLQSVCLVVGIAASTLLAFAITASWRCQRQYYASIIDVANITHEVRIPIEGTYSKYTVIVDSLGSKAQIKMKKRRKILSSIIKHYASCPSTLEIIVSHSSDDTAMTEYLENSFSPVYRPWVRHRGEDKLYDVGNLSIPTKAAVIISRGMMISCKDLENMFAKWRRDPHVLYGSNTFRQDDQPSPIPSDYFSALLSGIYVVDFENLVEMSRNESFNGLKSIAGEYDACDDVLLSILWTQACASPDPLRHIQPTRSIDLLPVGKNQADIYMKSKNECVDALIEEDASVFQEGSVYQVDTNPKVPMCKGLIF